MWHTKAWIGREMPRREDLRLVTGQGRYVDDLAPDGCLTLDILRNPFAAGRIVDLDVEATRAAPGVRLVLTATDLAGLGASAINPLLPGGEAVPMQVLADGVVRALGQGVVAVVADSREAARDALELVSLDVEEVPAATRTVLRHRWGAPVAASGNSAPAACGRAVSVRVEHALVAPFALEPRAALAVPDSDRLTVWLSTQTPQRCRDDLAAMLGLERDRIRVVAPDVGGAFGGKASLMPEDVLVACAALRLGRPVKWCATRSEEMQAATQGRGAVTSATLQVDAEGRACALKADLDYPLGHWMPYSALAPGRNAGRILPGPYDIAAVDVALQAHLSAGPAVNIYRGAGRPEATMLMERLMDRAAQALGLDPLEMRRRNVTPASVLPRMTPTGERLCSGDFAALLDRLAAETGYQEKRVTQARRRAAGEIVGLGLGLYIEPCGQGWETAEVRLMGDGTIVAATGASAQGQGRETAFAQIVADTLGIEPQAVRVVAGDTDAVPEGIGALASRSTAIGGSAMLLACRTLVTRAVRKAAALLGCREDALDVGPGGLIAPGGTLLVWRELAARLGAPDAVVLSASERYEAPGEAWASGAVLAEVAIEADTGTIAVEAITWVDDAGTMVNPLLAEGQLIGGLAQGLGAALMERVVYRDGQLLTGSLMDYALPRAADMPPVRIVSQPTPSPANALGVKGVGEAGCIGVPAALLNAVQDALLPFGAPDLSLPLTSEKVWRIITGLEP
ncbi:xanthine dehydrogenase family protein molybdopterin-binding subunit [Polymorphum gilvum]|uniref:Xanthine dehydrogenase family protein, large subunit n=1 Tax=Polymorphum gilvum (strain LMG 25793 / CGMCC 1.9160 / SL003B-26A1) TaxID=991905 RepID=F2IW07_POLGS|nr:xanthine dehydrogenase family protein molybdopterin-binding subunit [Polymorphum gilvum]ADZ70289.1 Xanthine dehydrogenase family protein, large subunit [Polymorphum gilvum SL003B-26A1]